MQDWSHQDRAVQQTLAAFESGQRRVCLCSPTGSGKTKIAQTLIKHYLEREKRCVLYSNRKLLVEQTKNVFEAAGIEVGVRASGYEDTRWQPLQVSSIQTEVARLKNPEANRGWALHDADLVIVDECFTGETLVSTPRGPCRIDNVRVGDTVHCATGIGVVEAISAKPALGTVSLEFSNGIQIECTGSHPFFTRDGWKPASALEHGSFAFGIEDVRRLWEDVPSAPVGRGRRDKSNRRNSLGSPDKLLAVLLEEGQEPNERKGQHRQDAETSAGNTSQAYQARRERAIAAFAATGSPSRSRRRMGVGVTNSNQDAKRIRISDRLQGGHREPREEDRHRDRRTRSRWAQKESGRRQEDGITCEVRLVRSSNIQRESAIPVFNLRVNGHPSYFANGILVHNCHVQCGPTVQDILTKHVEQGACVLGITATPVGIGALYDHLIVGAKNSELRKAGVLVPATMYGCDEPDLKKLKLPTGEDPSENQARKMMMTPTIFGRVLNWYRKLNPEGKPTLAFAPGVAESFWFAKQFEGSGISAAHIDGEMVYWNGREYPAGRSVKEDVLAASKCGDLKVIWNRFVLREGVDAPWIQHLILATVMGAIDTYIQTVGRGLRAYPGKTECRIQCHGGNWWRLGSPNSDREWVLEYTSAMIAAMREDRLRGKEDKEPHRCPECAQIVMTKVCPCGYEFKKKLYGRMVVQLDGSLKEMTGDIFKPRRIDTRKNAVDNWKRMYHRAKNSNMNFRQAMGCYCTENNWAWPSKDWPFMPIHPHDFFRLVKDVPMENLRGTNNAKREADLVESLPWDS